MSYELERQLPSCFVTKDVILEIEAFGTKKAASYNKPREGPPRAYELRIKDKNGVEVLTTIEEYKRASLPDDVQAVNLIWGAKFYDALRLEIHFSVNRWDSNVNIWFDGEDGRERCEGIYAELRSIIKHAETVNWMFHGWMLPVWILLLAPLAVIPSLTFKVPSTSVTVIMGVALALIGIRLIDTFKPYTMFDSKRTDRRKKQFNWLMLGILTFFLFTVIGVYLRNKLLGF